LRGNWFKNGLFLVLFCVFTGKANAMVFTRSPPAGTISNCKLPTYHCQLNKGVARLLEGGPGFPFIRLQALGALAGIHFNP
jgi:hypothetical protein